ncbi:MAG: diguanylate cyclase [Deltaproteobacteria bacterium]|nr:diguanylate cyclase [Deltaproteobacteria bacterium]
MSKNRIIFVSTSADEMINLIPQPPGEEVEIIVKEDFESLIELLRNETCSLILLASFKNGFPAPDRISQVQSVAPMTPIILLLPDVVSFDQSRYDSLKIAEMVKESEFPGKIETIVERYLYAGYGILRDWTLDEMFNYCFPIITTQDYDSLCQTIVDFLKELLMAKAGLLISPQEGRGSGFRLHSAMGFADMTLMSNVLAGYGDTLVAQCSDDPKILAVEEAFGDGKLPGLGDGVKSIFTVKIGMEGMNSVYAILFLKARPYPEVLEGQILQFILKHARYSLFNAEKSMQVQSLIFIDDLTKLYNSRYLKVVLDRELKRSDRYSMPVSILFLDIDYFKRVNDSYGHLVGSRVLCEFGSILDICVRETDTVVRYGGDEFVVILVETSPEQSLLAAERMRKAVESHIFMQEDGLDLHLTVSIGIATYPMHARDKDQLLQMADRAMYKGKETTRNVVYIADS